MQPKAITAISELEGDEDDNKSGWFRWRNDVLHLYGINYRFSNIVLDEQSLQALDKEDAVARAYTGYTGTVMKLRAGDRAPDAPALVLFGAQGDESGEPETSVFGLLKPSVHSVFIFVLGAAEGKSGETDSLVDEAAKYFPVGTAQIFVVAQCSTDADTLKKHSSSSVVGVTVFVDRESHFRTAYTVVEGEKSIVIIRPDAFIGAIVKDGAGLMRYCKAVYGHRHGSV